jgi:endo-1,4-beta-xylanase
MEGRRSTIRVERLPRRHTAAGPAPAPRSGFGRRRGLRGGALSVIIVFALLAGGCALRNEASNARALIGAAGTNPAYLDDPDFARVLGQQFNSLSPENELKWSFTEPQQGVFDFTKLDRLVAYAQAHHMAVKGHGLISGCCNPAWLQQITDPTALRAAMTVHFDALMKRYAGKIDRWDVVTEPLSIAGGTGLSPNDFSKVLGPGYIADAFNIAHAADPGAKLFLNESIVEFNATKRQELYNIVSGLVADGVPINGVGLEMHLFAGRPEPGVITDMVKAYRALGVEVAITEMDAFVDPNAANPLQNQAETYLQVLNEALDAGIRDISFWGFTDKYHGIWPDSAQPLLFDANFQPKPAYWAVFNALHRHGIDPSVR